MIKPNNKQNEKKINKLRTKRNKKEINLKKIAHKQKTKNKNKQKTPETSGANTRLTFHQRLLYLLSVTKYTLIFHSQNDIIKPPIILLFVPEHTM